jgi:hypothetical protein
MRFLGRFCGLPPVAGSLVKWANPSKKEILPGKKGKLGSKKGI